VPLHRMVPSLFVLHKTYADRDTANWILWRPHLTTKRHAMLRGIHQDLSASLVMRHLFLFASNTLPTFGNSCTYLQKAIFTSFNPLNIELKTQKKKKWHQPLHFPRSR
jgi:hypothetical protein